MNFKRATDILDRFADRLQTRLVVCEPGLTSRMPALLAEVLPPGKWALVADENTWNAQGRLLFERLEAAGTRPVNRTLAPLGTSRPVVCEHLLANWVGDTLRRDEASAVVAVGAGTICDIGKLAAESAGLPLAAVATAPSMNGYPSVIAAVLRQGVKRTDPTTPPVAVLADLDVLSAAPARMIASGYADLLAKPVSTADWTLANALLGDEMSADGLAVVEASSELADGIAPGLARREPAAVARLFDALFVSGLAMAVSGKSSPASGGEHLISHYLDMTALAEEGSGEHDLHGLQVGVATLVAASLYDRLLDEFDPAAFGVAARVACQPHWGEVEAELRGHFPGSIVESVIEQASRLYAEGDALAGRLTRFCELWPTLKPALAGRLASPDAIETELKAAGAATTFAEIGVDRDRALAAVRFAYHVRARYTILHLLSDLGLLDEWARDAVDARR